MCTVVGRANVGNSTLVSCTILSSGTTTLFSVQISGADGKSAGGALCRVARSCNSCARVGDIISPVRLYFLIAWSRSLIAATKISFVSGRGGVISVSGNQATVSVMRVADVAVAKT